MRTPATDLHGKTMLITGGTGGIGKETARGLAKLGAHVIVVGRDRVRAEAAVAELKATAGNERVDLLLVDLRQQFSVFFCVLRLHGGLHLLEPCGAQVGEEPF